ncbi:hypothetical protein JH06_4997 [Blastocystis sp. subtype 4]|uniref:hypothetical protein n=1 Tax=Blastocystis sp. subtype 4 TaxID=944170 RepID=UPI00071187BA|nr:hypothetical protein JH06_4997 [Blastocystis sp. subtype 4]KNB43494.1 hypothetical protein JH06_4997 [Blastocystis sp. subtype 4]|eukprot:XP_014526937.1 hypothetical protein JH06_4997 [Blastocystis sp. subtype 4]
MCDKYPRNYYAWTTLQTLLPSYTVDDILFELKYNQEFFSLHIKDYSALYRWQTLIMELHNRHYNLSLLQKLVSDEKKAIDYVQQVYGSNLSIQIHRECLNVIEESLNVI